MAFERNKPWVAFILIILISIPLNLSKGEEIEEIEGYISPVGILYDYSPERFQSALYNGKPTMLDFSADRCGPCRLMIPTMRALRTEYKGIADIITINADSKEGHELAREYGVVYLPSFIFFDKYGKPITTLVGYQEKEEIEYVLNKLLRGEIIEGKMPRVVRKTKSKYKEPEYEIRPVYEYEGKVLKKGEGTYEDFLHFGEIFSYENYGLKLVGTDLDRERVFINVLYMGRKTSFSGPISIGETLEAKEAKITLLEVGSQRAKLRVELPSTTRYELVGETDSSSLETSNLSADSAEFGKKIDLLIIKDVDKYNSPVGDDIDVILSVESNLDSNVKIRIIDTIPKNFQVVSGNLNIEDSLSGKEHKTYSYKIRPLKEGNYELPGSVLIYSNGNDEKMIRTEGILISVAERYEDKGFLGLLSSIFNKILEFLGLRDS